MNTVDLLGVKIDNVSMEEALQRSDELIAAGRFAYIVTPNVDHLIQLRTNRDFQEIYRGAALVVADGVPLLWAARVLGQPLKERINGTDLFVELCRHAAAKGHSVYLLGGNPGVAARVAEVLAARFAGLKVAGYYCPKIGFESDDRECENIRDTIARSGADILFVALGAPKQEKWIVRFGAGCRVKLAVGIGASFSFVAGDIRRAPLWMQRSGMEWFWRLICEPRRLFKRYIIDDMPFFWYVMKEWVQRRRR